MEILFPVSFATIISIIYPQNVTSGGHYKQKKSARSALGIVLYLTLKIVATPSSVGRVDIQGAYEPLSLFWYVISQ